MTVATAEGSVSISSPTAVTTAEPRALRVVPPIANAAEGEVTEPGFLI